MQREQQIELVTAICNHIRNDLIHRIETGKVPETWDGHELREWLADTFQFERTNVMRTNRKRRKDFKNDCLTRAI